MTTPGAPEQMRRDRIAALKVAGLLVGLLAVVGAILGVAWELWSPPGPAGLVLQHGIQADESEAFAAGDGRYALMTVVVGLIAGAAVWFLRAVRGVYVVVGLAAGAVLGALVTELVGWALRGDGRHYPCGDGSFTCIDHLPLTVHMHALWLLEAIAALLVYALCVAFAAADDLGRPDPGWRPRRRDRAAAGPAEPVGVGVPASSPSVGTERDLHDARGDGDAAGAP